MVTNVPDAKVPQSVQKPVVVGFISPQDSLLAVSIQLTDVVIGTASSVSNVTNAVVTISENNRFVALRYLDNSQGIYIAQARNFPIEAGKTYTLRVTMPSGQTLAASASVPAAVPIQQVVFDSAQTTTTQTASLSIKWTDPAGQPNYYRIKGDQVYSLTQPTGTYTATIDLAFRNENFRYLLTDANRDGQTLTSSSGYYQPYTVNGTGGAVSRLPGNILTLRLLTVDKMYYDYHSALQQFSDANGNPFAEPVLLPTNIAGGGIGCFAAYNQSLARIVLK
ncbi:hypothetical protein BLX24_04975 [Arsenicibacter rosenii]|uniref:DUF4249 domain-containing protein n=2 Tax=Arsenicibacter rosenii TaxID=1750698 RepID=A0A1S2VN40_9BACT|nr:hypothetical protein BLX24_04975 [Arsenicibacter rosenii]